MNAPRTTWFALGLALVAGSLAAQKRKLPPVPPVDSETVVIVRLLDWTERLGRVVARDDSTLWLKTARGTEELALAWVRAWRPQDLRLVLSDPSTSRLFFGTTGRTLPKRRGYFADYYLFFPYLAYGLSDRLTIAGGVSVVPAAQSQLGYVSPKYAVVRSPRLNFAVGLLGVTIPDTKQPSLGAVYGALTLGPGDRAVTIMAGYPFSTKDVAADPIVMLGAENRLGGRSKLLAELWALPDADAVPFVVGLRWFGERLAVDFGIAYPIGGEIGNRDWPLFPWVDFALHW